jgi:hypothetical protein
MFVDKTRTTQDLNTVLTNRDNNKQHLIKYASKIIDSTKLIS